MDYIQIYNNEMLLPVPAHFAYLQCVLLVTLGLGRINGSLRTPVYAALDIDVRPSVLITLPIDIKNLHNESVFKEAP